MKRKRKRKTGFWRIFGSTLFLLFVMFAFCFGSVPVNAAESEGDFTIRLEEREGKTYIAVDETSLDKLAETDETLMEAYLSGEFTITVHDAEENTIDVSKNIDDMETNIFYAEITIPGSTNVYTSNYLMWEGKDSGSGGGTSIDYCPETTIDYTVGSASEKITSSISGYFAKMTFYFEKNGLLSLSNQGDWMMYTSIDNGKTWSTFDIRFPLKIKAGTTLQLLIKGNKDYKGKLTYSYEDPGVSLENWNSKETALDISAGYDGTNIEFEPTLNEVWYKFTIRKESVVTFQLKDYLYTTYVDFYDENMKTQLDHEQYSADSPLPFYRWDRQNSENNQEDGIATEKLYKPGTYYFYVKDGHKYNGKLKFTVRDYIPISSIKLEKGDNVVISSNDEVEYYENNVVEVYPANTDGQIASIKYDPEYISKEYHYNMPRTKKYGISVVRYYDERGVEVAQSKVTVVPALLEGARYEGGVKEIRIYAPLDMNACNADYIRIYQKKGSKWVLIDTVQKKKFVKVIKGTRTEVPYKIKKLKPQTNYQFRLTYYDKASGMESKEARTDTAGTAYKAKTSISGVSGINYGMYKDAYVHNPGRWNEWREPYEVHTAKATVSIKKVKKCKEYELSGFNIFLAAQKKFVKKTTNKNLVLASAQHSRSRLPKTIKLKVRTVRRTDINAVAYGPWSKVKTVRIR